MNVVQLTHLSCLLCPFTYFTVTFLKPNSHRYVSSALLPECLAPRALFPFGKYLQVWLFKIKLLEKFIFSEIVFLLIILLKNEMVLKISFSLAHIDLTIKNQNKKTNYACWVLISILENSLQLPASWLLKVTHQNTRSIYQRVNKKAISSVY